MTGQYHPRRGCLTQECKNTPTVTALSPPTAPHAAAVEAMRQQVCSKTWPTSETSEGFQVPALCSSRLHSYSSALWCRGAQLQQHHFPPALKPNKLLHTLGRMHTACTNLLLNTSLLMTKHQLVNSNQVMQRCSMLHKFQSRAQKLCRSDMVPCSIQSTCNRLTGLTLTALNQQFQRVKYSS